MAEKTIKDNNNNIAIKEADKKYTKTQITKKIYYAKKTNPKKYERLMKTYRDWHPSDEELSDDDKQSFLLTDDEYENIRKALNIDFQEKQIEKLQKLFNNKNLLENVINFFKDRNLLQQQK